MKKIFNRSIRRADIAALLLMLLVASPAPAKTIVGDKPELKTRAMDGSTVDLSTRAGKMVLVDFFGKSDMSKRHEQAVLDLYKKYADKGLVVIGVCAERRAADATDLVRDLRLPWPIILEPEGWQGGLGKEWGLPMIPQVYLIGPDGDVLWTGLHNFEATIDAEMIKHPPVLVDPAILASASSTLDAVEQALSTNDYAKAIRLFGQINPDASKNPDFAKRLADDHKKLSDAADQMLTASDSAATAKDYVQAFALLKAIAALPADIPAQPTARQKLADLMVNPEVKAQFQSAARESAAQAALAEARSLRDKQQDAAAYVKFKSIASDYAGTPTATEAAQAVKTYESDPDFMHRFKEDAIAAKAKTALNLADNYRSAGHLDQARNKYQEIIDQFPGTRYAEQAKSALDAMK